MLVCKVVVKRLPFQLDYLAKDGTSATDYPFGVRVKVPYRNTNIIGIVVGLSGTLSVCQSKAKKVESILENRGFLSIQEAFYKSFCHYYSADISRLLQMCLPKHMWESEEDPSSDRYEARVDRVVARSHLTASAWKLYDWVLKEGQGKRCGDLLAAGFRRSTIKQCLDKEMLKTQSTRPNPQVQSPNLTENQQAILVAIVQEEVQKNHYIYGVTGSGKTYLYIALAQHWISKGGQVLMLVPEIGLTPQLIKRVSDYFDPTVVGCLHSGLSDNQRHQTWHDCSVGTVQLLIGTRSALFAPLPRLKAIIVDEEHDLSYQQMSQIRYSARGVSFMRAKADKAHLVLGSATPSLAALKLISDGLLFEHRLNERFKGYCLPEVELVSIKGGKTEVGFASRSLEVIKDTLAKGKRVLVFINRRGYAPCLWCPGCDKNLLCHGCDRTMTYHQSEKMMECHRCQVKRKVDYRCEYCKLKTCIPLGEGTEKVAIFLQSYLAGVDILKMDRDSCKTWRQIEALLEVIHRPGPKVIVATQMLVKGHHIENLDAVVVMGADQSLFSKDYKAREHLFAQMHQVIGRSGRDGSKGRVLIQTAHIENPIWKYVVSHEYLKGASGLLAERSQYALPPYTTQVAIHFSGKQQDRILKLATSLAERIKRLHKQITVIGPMPSLQAKLKGSYRVVLLLQAQTRAEIHAALQTVARFESALQMRAALVIDRDPVEI